MIRDILTLIVDKKPTQYYINFEKERKRFAFQPTLNNKTAPAFVIVVEKGKLITEGLADDNLEKQAKEKIKEILSNNIFDQF